MAKDQSPWAMAVNERVMPQVGQGIPVNARIGHWRQGTVYPWL